MCEVTPDGDIIIGRTRPRNNPLIHRSVVGKPSSHNDMPPLPEDHTFGAALRRDPEGAGDVMLSWSAGKQTKSNPVAQEAINRRNAKRFAADPDRVYGAKSGDKSNMADLMQNRYELEWVKEQKARHETIVKAQEKEKKRKAAPTRISVERNERMQQQKQTLTKPHPKEYFTLSQFRNVPSRFGHSPTRSQTSMSHDYYSANTHTQYECNPRADSAMGSSIAASQQQEQH